MKIKTSELEGAALDWAVAEAIDLPERDTMHGSVVYMAWCEVNCCRAGDDFRPSTDWSQGGPLIEALRVSLLPEYGADWEARTYRTEMAGLTKGWGYSEEPLVAAMRAIVASELGDEIEVPDELCP